MNRISGITRKVYLVAAGIIRREQEVLLVRQKGAEDAGFTWDFPGGVVEAGELLGEALIREIREETGLEALEIGRLA